MPSIVAPELFVRLRGARNVLVCGAGGGFDVFAALPIGLALADLGVNVHFANLTFTYLGGTDAVCLAPHLFAVTPDTEGEERYFPERALATWLRSAEMPSVVHAFEKVGVRPLTRAYATLAARLSIDAVVLVDGGTDILMFGDEAGLGTPQEDMVSLAAVAALDVPTKLLACLGFGVDSFHGVCHAHFLENVATLERDGGYLGAFSVPRSSSEGTRFLDAVALAGRLTPQRPSIVNESIAAAIRGEFGNVALGERTAQSELFINPLMGLYFTFELASVVRRSLYLEKLAATETIFQVSAIIEAFRRGITVRPRRPIPH